MDKTTYKVLVIEDNSDDILAYRRYLNNYADKKFEITVRHDGTTALEFLRSQTVDCILLDFQLPDMSGLDLIKEYKKENTELLPIVILTGQGNEKIVVELLRLGALDYLVKDSLNAEVLPQAILNAIEKSQQAQIALNEHDQIVRLAHQDYLTGLANRMAFEKALVKSIARAQRFDLLLGIFLIDLDDFKEVNDNLGHAAGDMLLKNIATRFSAVVRQTDVLARLGGDEFVLLADSIRETADVEVIAEKLLKTLKEDYFYDRQLIKPSASIGIAVFPPDGVTIDELLRNADKALYQAKEAGKNTFRVFANPSEVTNSEPTNPSFLVEQALNNHDLQIQLSPMINKDSSEITAVEMLPKILLSKERFFNLEDIKHLSGKNQLLQKVNEMIFLQTIKQYQHILETESGKIKIALNLSVEQLMIRGWLQSFQKELQYNQVHPKNLILEISVNHLVVNKNKMVEAFLQLKNLGCQIYLDEFNFSKLSIHELQQIPLTGVKLDEKFLQDYEQSKNFNVLRATIDLIQTLKLQVVLCGVNTTEQYQTFQGVNNIQMQGKYITQEYGQKAFEIIEVSTSLT